MVTWNCDKHSNPTTVKISAKIFNNPTFKSSSIIADSILQSGKQERERIILSG